MTRMNYRSRDLAWGLEVVRGGLGAVGDGDWVGEGDEGSGCAENMELDNKTKLSDQVFGVKRVDYG